MRLLKRIYSTWLEQVNYLIENHTDSALLREVVDYNGA